MKGLKGLRGFGFRELRAYGPSFLSALRALFVVFGGLGLGVLGGSALALKVPRRARGPNRVAPHPLALHPRLALRGCKDQGLSEDKPEARSHGSAQSHEALGHRGKGCNHTGLRLRVSGSRVFRAPPLTCSQKPAPFALSLKSYSMEQ